MEERKEIIERWAAGEANIERPTSNTEHPSEGGRMPDTEVRDGSHYFSATRSTRRVDWNSDAMAEFAAHH